MGLLRVLYYCILRPLWYCIIKPLCGCCFPDCYPETLETGLKKSPYRLHGYIHEMATDEDGVFYKDPTAAKEMLCNELTAAIEISFASTNEIVPEASLDEQKKILELLYTTDAQVNIPGNSCVTYRNIRTPIVLNGLLQISDSVPNLQKM